MHHGLTSEATHALFRSVRGRSGIAYPESMNVLPKQSIQGATTGTGGKKVTQKFQLVLVPKAVKLGTFSQKKNKYN